MRIKTLKEFMAKKKYVAITYDRESQKKLREWAIENGFDLTKSYDGEDQDPKDFEFHTTIFFTTNEVNLPNKRIKVDPTEVAIQGIKFLGENEDIPVLKLELTGKLKDLRKQYEDLGLEDQWPTYQPHISLSYAKEKRDVSKIKIPTFTPKYDIIAISDIKD
jgi:2'-5' RNA ligase